MLVTLEEAVAMINEGKILHFAADDSLLKKLPKGKWIGGTTPYFMSEEGGIQTKDRLFADVLDFASEAKISVYGKYNVFQIVEDCYDNGLILIIMPYGSAVATKYAREAPEVEELLMHPTIGWISGFDLETGGEARVYDGETGEAFTDKAVVMHIGLPEEKSAMINMINIFSDDKTDPVIRFSDNELDIRRCTVNGQEVDFSEYIRKKRTDAKLPLVADYNGAYINTSVREVSDGKVSLYAPVFKDVEYRFAVNVDDYAKEFRDRIDSAGARQPVLSFNCILNYQYGKLEGRKTPPYTGPVTFGEVAYQLLNQTLVYCEILG